MKTIISKYTFLLAAVLTGSAMLAKADQPSVNTSVAKVDTVQNINEDFNLGTKKSAVDRAEKQKQREQMLEKLSKMPADFPEVFSNAKEEYLWKEKVKADQDEFERHVRAMNLQNQQRSQH